MYRYGLHLLIVLALFQQTFSSASSAITYTIIVTGDELLRGKYSDSHTQSITRALGPLGFRCTTSITVGDKGDDLLRALENATQQSNLILVTGGLGPTRDDITREVLSKFSGIPLQENAEVIAHLERRFSVKPGGLRDNLRRQGQTPVKGTYFANHHGTAVGLLFDSGDQLIAALPGPPQELQPMLTERLAPFLVQRLGTRSPEVSLQMRFVGIGESNIDKTIRDHLILPGDVEVSSLFDTGRVDLTFSLPGDSPGAINRLQSLEKQLLVQLGRYMYSDKGETLEQCIIGMLAAQDLTLSLAEVGSGGAIAASLHDLSGSRTVLKGGFTAASDSWMDQILRLDSHRSSSEFEKDQAVLNRLCMMLDSKWGLIVREPQVAEDSSRSVDVVIGSSKGILVKKRVPLRGRGRIAQSWLVTSTLDLLRRELGRSITGN